MNNRVVIFTFVLMPLVFVLCGCGEVSGRATAVDQGLRLGKTAQYSPGINFVAGKSVRGREIRCRVFGTGEDTVMIIGGIHGNEPASVLLAEQLGDHLAENPQAYKDTRVVLLENVNPDGNVANTRTNASGVDLNRNFPAGNRVNNSRNGWYALSEPESRIIERLVNLYEPSRVVVLHQPYACIDYDGPGRYLAERMAERCPLPVRKLGALPGSLGSWLGVTKRVPAITMELPAGAENRPDRLWPQYGQSLTASIQYGK